MHFYSISHKTSEHNSFYLPENSQRASAASRQVRSEDRASFPQRFLDSPVRRPPELNLSLRGLERFSSIKQTDSYGLSEHDVYRWDGQRKQSSLTGNRGEVVVIFPWMRLPHRKQHKKTLHQPSLILLHHIWTEPFLLLLLKDFVIFSSYIPGGLS